MAKTYAQELARGLQTLALAEGVRLSYQLCHNLARSYLDERQKAGLEPEPIDVLSARVKDRLRPKSRPGR
jgi:uncharacterized protein YwlG (UPF0340 family)